MPSAASSVEPDPAKGSRTRPPGTQIRTTSRISSSGFCTWWTRSPGGEADRHSYISFDGRVNAYGYFRTFEKFAVRPAIVLRLSELEGDA